VLVAGVLVGSYLGGRFVNIFGRKNLIVGSLLVVSLLMVGLMNSLSPSMTLGIIAVMSFIGGVRFTGSNTLTMDQVPEMRGTMMSLSQGATSLGAAMGRAISGLVLLMYGWQYLGYSLAVIGVIGAVIYLIFAQEPIPVVNHASLLE
ncbi:unnamed protein product, partial [marine sediment metagenome]